MYKFPLNLVFQKAVSLEMALQPFRQFPMMERCKSRRKLFSTI